MKEQDYVMLGVSLIFRGTEFQRKCILWYMNNLQSNEDFINELKLFIDTQVRLGKIKPQEYGFNYVGA